MQSEIWSCANSIEDDERRYDPALYPDPALGNVDGVCFVLLLVSLKSGQQL